MHASRYDGKSLKQWNSDSDGNGQIKWAVRSRLAILYSELPPHGYTSIKNALALLQSRKHLLQADEERALSWWRRQSSSLKIGVHLLLSDIVSQPQAHWSSFFPTLIILCLLHVWGTGLEPQFPWCFVINKQEVRSKSPEWKSKLWPSDGSRWVSRSKDGGQRASFLWDYCCLLHAVVGGARGNNDAFTASKGRC